MINLFLSLTKSMSLRIIWMLFLIPSCVFSANELYRRCSQPFNCGDQSGLLYPFWIPGREECGHPEFKLECHNRSAEVSFSSVKFRLLDANYISHKIRLARSDFLNNMCPQSPLNVSFMDNVLPFAPNTDVLTIYYGCKFSREVYTFGGMIGCPDDKNIEHGRNYFVTRNLSSPLLQEISSSLNEFRRLCERNVSVPASGPSLNRLQTSPNVENLGKALRDGFELGLNQECLMCIGSKGACGYNQTSSGFICYCEDESQKGTCSSRKKGISYGIAAKIGSGVGVSLFLILILALFHQIHRKRKTPHDLDQQNLTLLSQPKLKSLIPLKEYSYAQVKRITKSFAEEVGKGGFGTVYKGTLSDGRMVAVKVLNESKGNNSEDFINEVASMSQTSHVNIVTLLGFCSEGSKRAIIYEFLENGSLDKFISLRTSMDRDWKELSRIALGVARGLEYLHHGCKTRIVHFDIKPQNVLLDDNLVPKVSDFGLAKLCEKKESILSLLDTRGTIGYIAPELFSRMYGRVSHKSDVYSYGMLVLEMIGATNEERGAQNSASNTSSMYFPEWIYKDIEKGDTRKLVENGIGIEENELAKKMSMVGLWCIQSSPADRPPMNRVVEMMEGNLDALEVPPRPAFEIPSGPFPESSTLFSEDTSDTQNIIKKKTSLNHHESSKYLLST